MSTTLILRVAVPVLGGEPKSEAKSVRNMMFPVASLSRDAFRVISPDTALMLKVPFNDEPFPSSVPKDQIVKINKFSMLVSSVTELNGIRLIS